MAEEGSPAGSAGAAPPRGSLVALVAANLLPMAGVLFWGWQVGDVVILYWAENLVIGAYFALRMLAAAGVDEDEDPDRIGSLVGWLVRLPLIAFFCVHFGMFCFVHGVFLVELFPPGGLDFEPDFDPHLVLWAMMQDRAVLAAMAAIVASHGYSFFANFLGRGEYRRTNPAALMMMPYGRIVFTHIFILAGAFAVAAMGSTAPILMLFVGLKIAFDAHAHRKEHRAKAALEEPQDS